MICHQGRVISNHAGSALIAVDPQHACQACASGKGCGLSIFSRWLGSRSICLRVRRSADWQPGQVVSIKVAPGLLLKMAAWAYGLPLFGFIAGAGAATLLAAGSLSTTGGDLVALACGVGGLWVGALCVRHWASPIALTVAAGHAVLIE